MGEAAPAARQAGSTPRGAVCSHSELLPTTRFPVCRFASRLRLLRASHARLPRPCSSKFSRVFHGLLVVSIVTSGLLIPLDGPFSLSLRWPLIRALLIFMEGVAIPLHGRRGHPTVRWASCSAPCNVRSLPFIVPPSDA